jgi:hypothetical protein
MGPAFVVPPRSWSPPSDDADPIARFPAGRGVTSTSDELYDVLQTGGVRSMSVGYDERLAAARRLLGVAGDDVDGGVAFRAVSARTVVAPYGCQELVIMRSSPPLLRPTDHKHCGLPYAADPAVAYTGPGPRRTVTRLKKLLAEITGLSSIDARDAARRKLGAADHVEGLESEWIAIGARGDDAPVTCHVLRIGANTRIEQRALAHCGLTWPAPLVMFDPGPQVEPVSEAPYLDECTKKCSTREICLLDRRTPAQASLVTTKGQLSAHWMDGRPAQIELSASCAPIPASCARVDASCFFPQPTPAVRLQPPPLAPGPCPPPTFSGYSFLSSPMPHITCFSRVRS